MPTVFYEEFKWNLIVGAFFGCAFLASLYDPRNDNIRAIAALKENLFLTFTITFALVVIFHGIIVHLFCWVTSVLIKVHITGEIHDGERILKRIRYGSKPSDQRSTDIVKEVEKTLKVGIPNALIENELIPCLLDQYMEANEDTKSGFFNALRMLVEHGYWKALYSKKTIGIIIEGYRNEDQDVRIEADILLYELIRHETIDEILETDLLPFL